MTPAEAPGEPEVAAAPAPVGPPAVARFGRGLTRAALLTALAFSALFTALCLQWSLTNGRLSQDSTYDDCTYLYDGDSRLMILYEHGFEAFFADAVKNPAHAPFSAYGATLAFALFGVHDWAPYVLNGLIVCALLGLVSHMARRLSLPWRAALMGLSLTLPIAISLVHDYRPDSICALLSIIGMYLVAEAGVYRAGRAQRQALVAGGIAFGLALWAKPPVFALTLVTALVATGGAWLATSGFNPLRDARRAWGSAWRMGASVALPCALVAAPYYAINGATVVRYFLFNSFDKNSDFWKVPGGWGGALHFYLLGEAGELLMGRGFYAWVGLYVLALGWIAWRRQTRELVLQGILLLLTGVSLAAVVYGRIQNPFFGMTWVMLLMITCLRAWALVLSTLRLARWQGLLAGLLILALGMADLVLLRLHNCWPSHTPSVDELVGRGHSTNQRILDDISREMARHAGKFDQPPMTFLTVTGFINQATLHWLAFRAGQPLVFSDRQLDSHLQPFREAMADASFVVSGEDKTGGVFEFMPPWKLRFQLADLVAAEERAGRLRQLARYPTSAGGSYRLFVNEEKLALGSGGFSPLSDWEGFLPFEGPYPEFHGGRVRWATGSRSQFTFDAAAPGEANLDLWVRAPAPIHAQVLLGGNPVGAMDVPVEPEFRHIVIPVTLRAGANQFTLAGASEPPVNPDGIRRAVLFLQLKVEPTP